MESNEQNSSNKEKILKVVTASETAILPRYGSDDAAGLDFFADLPEGEIIFIEPGETATIPSGIKVEFPEMHYGDMRPRSSMSAENVIVHGIIDEVTSVILAF
jgi:dUTP pyrophosphatase